MIASKSEIAAGKDREPSVTRPAIIFIAGFGDNASMFDGLLHTHLAERYRLLPINLPGFGAPTLRSQTTLEALAKFVADKAEEAGAKIIVAHSVASIIASLAAQRSGCPLTTIISLEGNITAEDAYFSGTAADFDGPEEFRAAFLERLDQMAKNAPVIDRYRQSVSQADQLALWQLGTDARRFSSRHVPGEVLKSSGNVVYLYNPENCPETTIQWLEHNPLERIVLANATHWKSVDQPEQLADKISEALHRV
ncbi:alpha/beta hydrolase [Mameliella alba]|nr:alpha/beta hydrolase [Antarctobacter heliothermus]MBY6146168.1 alpha/beta hydrolase [Mameliella alba]MCA0955353.1 alpha/beta hydrolase [Mameliella alba]